MHKTTHPCGGTHPPLQQSPPKNDAVPFPILQHRHRHDHHRHRCCAATIAPPFMVTAAVTSAASSWLRNRRIRYFFLLLCSPLLLVLLCVALPFLCAAELCISRRLWRKILRDSGGDRLRRCEEGCCSGCGGEDEEEVEKGLLHRYLEDQLLLVGSMYDCGDIEEEDVEDEDSRRFEDVENLGSNAIPLLR